MSLSAWNITSNDAGNISESGFDVLDFTNFGNLTGGTQNDTFIFTNGKTVSGNVNGGGGYDTLNWSAYTTPVSVNLQSATATGIGGTFANIEQVIGGSSDSVSNTLTGQNVASTWNVTSNDAGNISESGSDVLDFTNFGDLTGGTQDDTFVFANGKGVNGNINGGGGYNTLNWSAYTTPVSANLQTATATGIGGTFANIEQAIGGSSDTSANTLTGQNVITTWSITGSDAGYIYISGADVLNFTDFGNLTGGSQSDSFNFSGGGVNGAVNGVINGMGGVNVLDYSAYATPVVVNLQPNTYPLSTTGGTVTLQPNSATGTAGVLNIQYVTGSRTANDTLIGNDQDNYLIGGSATNILDGDLGTNTLNGGSGVSTYFISTTSQDTVTSTAGSDNTVNFSHGTAGVTIDMDSHAVQSVDSDGTTVQMTGPGVIQNFVGTPLNDTITMTPLTVARNVDGGGHVNPIPPGNHLILNTSGLPLIDNGQSLTAPGFAPVSYENIDMLNSPGNVTAKLVGGVLQLSGDTKANDVLIQALSAGKYEVTGRLGTTINGSSAPVILSASSGVAVSLGNGNNMLQVGTYGSSSTFSNIAVSTGGGNNALTFTGITAGKLQVVCGPGNDYVQALRLELQQRFRQRRKRRKLDRAQYGHVHRRGGPFRRHRQQHHHRELLYG